MKITYDRKTDSLNIALRRGRVKRTLELAPEVLLDLDVKGKALHLEVIGLSEKTGRNKSTVSAMRSLVPAR